MSGVGELYDRNARFADGFDKGDLPLKPSLSMIILCCVDARVSPEHVAGVELGDALVLRTAGARVTDGAALEVRMLWTLMSMATGATPNLELVIISHTQCGMERFAVPEVAAKVTEIFGSSDVVDTYAITDVNEAVSTDIERLRADASMPRELKVSGHVYDIATGQLREVAPTSTLG